MKNGEKKVDWLIVLGLRNDKEVNSLGLIFVSYVLDLEIKKLATWILIGTHKNKAQTKADTL